MDTHAGDGKERSTALVLVRRVDIQFYSIEEIGAARHALEASAAHENLWANGEPDPYQMQSDGTPIPAEKGKAFLARDSWLVAMAYRVYRAARVAGASHHEASRVGCLALQSLDGETYAVAALDFLAAGDYEDAAVVLLEATRLQFRMYPQDNMELEFFAKVTALYRRHSSFTPAEAPIVPVSYWSCGCPSAAHPAGTCTKTTDESQRFTVFY